MKSFGIFIVLSVITVLVLPLLIYAVSGIGRKDIEKTKTDISEEETIRVYFPQEQKVKELELEKYLCSVVAAEMPASFEEEALKAQAVAARSYAMYKKANPGSEHPEADVCTDYTHCKAYKTEKELNELWKDKKEEYSKKINSAVYATKGEIITYNGEAALAVFHSQTGNGKTESSKDVWGGDVPYLVSVESYGENTAPDFYSTVNVSFDEFKSKLWNAGITVTINSSEDIGKIESSEGGNVKSITIGDTEVSGKELRQIFGLRSTCFKISADNKNVVFNVEGYGHGVGMSQYGANAMAKEGLGYKDILTHYYRGTTISAV